MATFYRRHTKRIWKHIHHKALRATDKAIIRAELQLMRENAEADLTEALIRDAEWREIMDAWYEDDFWRYDDRYNERPFDGYGAEYPDNLDDGYFDDYAREDPWTPGSAPSSSLW